jgi:phosphoglycerate dehydrogenase-like enzyme
VLLSDAGRGRLDARIRELFVLSVLCLRPEADFARVGALPPPSLTVQNRKPDDADVPALMRAAQALVIPAVGAKLAPALFEGTALKLVQVTGAGLDRLDQAALTRLGIPVANVIGNPAVAEYVVGAATTLLRRFAFADAQIKRGKYTEYRARMLAENLAGLDGLLVGIVGFGVIGRSVAEAFSRLGCRICYHDPALQSALPGTTALPLQELLQTADVVTLHVPLLPSTVGLIGARELALMKSDAVLINAARGGVVDEAALAAALAPGKLGGAAVDVYSTEPPAPDNPLLKLTGEAAQKLLLTPHIAGVTRQSSAYLFRTSWENVKRVLVRNEPPLYRAY